MLNNRKRKKGTCNFEPLQQDISLARLQRVHRNIDMQAQGGEPAVQQVETACTTTISFEQVQKEIRKPLQAKWTSYKTNRWLRLGIVSLLSIMMLRGGMIVGYVIMGKGTLAEVFQMEMWLYVFKWVFA